MEHHESPIARTNPSGKRQPVCDNRLDRKSGRRRVNGPPPAQEMRFLMHAQPIRRIPVRGEDPITGELGILGFAIVDADDYERFGDRRWHLKNGYVSHRKQTGKWPNATYVNTALHRAVVGLAAGDGWVVDHINRNKLDNRKANLRICDQSVNSRNSKRRPDIASSSGFRNVHWDANKNLWLVSAKFGGRRFFSRRYRTKEEAIAVAAAVSFCLDRFEPKAVGS